MKSIWAFLLAIGLMILPAATFAADDAFISSVEVELASTATSATTDATFTIQAASEISSGDVITIATFLENLQGSPFATGFGFGGVSFSSSTITGTYSTAEGGEVGYITLSQALSAGTHTFVLSNFVNTATEGTYEFLLTTESFAPNVNGTASNTVVLAACETDGEVTGISKAPFGDNIYVTWDEFSGATTYTVQWSTTEDFADYDEATDLTETAYTIEDLTKSTKYYVKVLANTDNCDAVATTSTVSGKTKARVASNILYPKPRLGKKIQDTEATVKWKNMSDAITTFTLKLTNSKGKVITTVKDIPATTLSKKFTELKPGTMYRVRIRANYVNGETSKYSRFTRFVTKKAE